MVCDSTAWGSGRHTEYMGGSDADHNVSTFEPPAHVRKRGGKGGRIDVVQEQVVDMRHAIRELEAAIRELESLPHGLTRRQREEQTVEPMSRVDLVRRYCVRTLTRNGWKEAQAK